MTDRSVATARLRKKGQITIPQHVRAAANLEEGATLECVATPEGVLLRRRVTVTIDPEQAWFWTPEWQARMEASQEDIEAGRSEFHGDGDELLEALRGSSRP